MVVLYWIFGFIQICLFSNLILKCSSKQTPRRAPGSSARSSQSIKLLASRSGSNPPPKSSTNSNDKRNIQSLPSRSSQPKSAGGSTAATGGGTGEQLDEAAEKLKEEMAAKPAPPPAPQKKFKKSIKREPKTPDEDYGEVPEPTHSAKKRREKQLEEEKQEKIGKGFYQPKSDEDDTLEPIQSLKEERTENSTKKSTKKKFPNE